MEAYEGGLLVLGFIFGIGTMMLIAINYPFEYPVLQKINHNLQYCPHSDYYYNDHMQDCDKYGINPTHTALNLTGYGN